MEDVEVPLPVFSSCFTRLGFLDGADVFVPLQMGPFFSLSLMSIGYFGCFRFFFRCNGHALLPPHDESSNKSRNPIFREKDFFLEAMFQHERWGLCFQSNQSTSD